jgi:opacity protein-like surface antigen
MKRILALAAIAFTLVAGAAAVVIVSPQQAFAHCGGDHQGS